MTPEEIINQNLSAPKKVQVGNQSVESQSLADQIAAAEFLANQATPPHKAIHIARIRPGGAV
jgi:hypothetical protein